MLLLLLLLLPVLLLASETARADGLWVVDVVVLGSS
jgi:hypothetical protein